MEGLLYLIEERFNGFTHQNKKIASYILKEPDKFLWKSSKDIAETIGVSQASITRFCQSLDFSGFSELRIVLSQEIVRYNEHSFNNLDSEDFKKNIPLNLLNRNISSFYDTLAMLDNDEVMKAAKLINDAKKILCIGIGASGLVAQDMVQKLLRIQKNVCFYLESDLQKLAITQYTNEDLLFAVSYSGKKKEILDVAQTAAKQNVPIIALTRVGDTPLSNIADISFKAAAFENEYRTSAISSRLVHLFFVDVLFYTYGLHFQFESLEKLRKTFDIVNPR